MLANVVRTKILAGNTLGDHVRKKLLKKPAHDSLVEAGHEHNAGFAVSGHNPAGFSVSGHNPPGHEHHGAGHKPGHHNGGHVFHNAGHHNTHHDHHQFEEDHSPSCLHEGVLRRSEVQDNVHKQSKRSNSDRLGLAGLGGQQLTQSDFPVLPEEALTHHHEKIKHPSLEDDHLRHILGGCTAEILTKIQEATEFLEKLWAVVDGDGDGLASYYETKLLFEKWTKSLSQEADRHIYDEERTSHPKITFNRFVDIFLPLALSVDAESVASRKEAVRTQKAFPKAHASAFQKIGKRVSLHASVHAAMAHKPFDATRRRKSALLPMGAHAMGDEEAPAGFTLTAVVPVAAPVVGEGRRKTAFASLAGKVIAGKTT